MTLPQRLAWKKTPWVVKCAMNWRWWLALPLLIPLLPFMALATASKIVRLSVDFIADVVESVDRWIQWEMPGGELGTRYAQWLLSWVKTDFDP